MFWKSAQDGDKLRLEVQKSKAERIFIVLIIVATPFAGIHLFIRPEVLNAIEGDPSSVLVVIMGLISIGMGLYGLLYGKRCEWFGERYVIDDEGITKTMPSGKSQHGKWSDLTFVSCDLKLMGFGDGTVIVPSLLWDQIKYSDFKRVLEISGPESPLARAREFRQHLYKTTKAQRAWLVLSGLLLLFALAMVYRMPDLEFLGIEPTQADNIVIACGLIILLGFTAAAIWQSTKRKFIAIREKRRFLAGLN